MSGGHDDFALEPVHGLPERLPAGEKLRWQGSPGAWSLAGHALHVRKVAIYFALLIGWVIAAGIHDGMSLAELGFPLSMLALCGSAAVGTLVALGWASARGAIFSITDKRIVVRFGVALPLTLNVPLKLIDEVAVRRYRDGSGDIPLKLSDNNTLSWVVLWPFVRPWRLREPEIMLRSLPEADTVVGLLGELLRQNDPQVARPETPSEAGSVAADRRSIAAGQGSPAASAGPLAAMS